MRTYSACVPSMVLPRIHPPLTQCEYIPFRQYSHFPHALMHEMRTSWFECRDSWPNGFNETYAFVTEHATWSARGDIALEDVKVDTADSGLGDLDNRICWLRNCRLRPLFEGLFSRALKYQCLHKRCP